MARSVSPHDFSLFHALQVLLEQRSVSRAADHLGVSQPAMSRILARLRDQFKDPLLVRGRNGMMLTPRAEALQSPLRRWLREGDSLLAPPEFEPGSTRRVFRIASSDFGMLSVVAPAVSTLQAEAPNGSLAVEPLAGDSLGRLAEGELDLVITGYPPEGAGLNFRLLFSDHYLGLAGGAHPIHQGAASRADLLNWPHVVTHVGRGLGDWIAEALPEIEFGRGVIQSNSFSLTPYLVAAGEAVAILPARAARRFARTHGLKTFEAPVEIEPLDYFIVWHDRSQTDPGALWLINILSEATPDRSGSPEANDCALTPRTRPSIGA